MTTIRLAQAVCVAALFVVAWLGAHVVAGEADLPAVVHLNAWRQSVAWMIYEPLLAALAVLIGGGALAWLLVRLAEGGR